jgi:hypothetical protein
MARNKLLEKILRYHLPLADTDPEAAMSSAALHWKGFSWRSGPVIVKWFSDNLPEIQVWAETEEEGKRVVRHALAHIGANEDSGVWYSAVTSGNRLGLVGTVYANLVSSRSTDKGVTPHIPIL